MMNKFKLLPLLAAVTLLTGCITPITPIVKTDIAKYQQHMPKSILVLPPINDSSDTRATYSYWPSVMFPLAEAGYYVFPVSLVDSMFKENGITTPYDAQQVPASKLADIFGADAAIYIRIKNYGSKYQIISTTTTVGAEAKLVDLKTQIVLWEGERAFAIGSNQNQNLIGMLVGALVDQIVNDLSDKGYPVSSLVNSALFLPQDKYPGLGLLYGPRSPKFQLEGKADTK